MTPQHHPQHHPQQQHHRSSILLDSSLLAEAKKFARRHRTTATRIVEQAVREFLARQAPQKPSYQTEDPGRQDVTERAEKIRRRLHRPEGW